MGVFTQDLTQDLDQTARAVVLVTSMARQCGPQSATRLPLCAGALGLRQEGTQTGGSSEWWGKPSGPASFVLIPHFLLWDEPTNILTRPRYTSECPGRLAGGACWSFATNPFAEAESARADGAERLRSAGGARCASNWADGCNGVRARWPPLPLPLLVAVTVPVLVLVVAVVVLVIFLPLWRCFER